MLTFARWALAIYDVTAPSVRLGGVGLFEAFLGAMGISPQWQQRIRHRFGHPVAMQRLLDRLANPTPRVSGGVPDARETVVEIITDNMLSAGLSLVGSRVPDEIAERYLEKQALDAVPIPAQLVQLLIDYLQVSDIVPRALDKIRELTRRTGIDLDAPLATVRTHAAALSALSPKAGGDVRRELLAATRLLHRRSVRNDRREWRCAGFGRRISTVCWSGSAQANS